MSRDKQIEEMTELLRSSCAETNEEYCEKIGGDCGICDATRLYNAGYRKASDVAEEIFAEIDKLLYQDEKDYDDLMESETVAEIYQEYLACSNYIDGIRHMFAELKKKYTKEIMGEE